MRQASTRGEWPPGFRGFSLLECLVSLALASLLIGMLLPVVAWGAKLAREQPDITDVDQRLRIASSAIRLALDDAGAGVLAGDAASGVASRIPMVFPHWRGVEARDAFASAFTDRFTVLSARRSGWDVELASSMSSPISPLALAPGPPCAPVDQRCGFRRDDVAVVYDRLGRFDLLRVATIESYVLTPATAPLVRAFGIGDHARAAPVFVHQFRYDEPRRQLRVGTGNGLDAPLLDEVAGLAVEYHGTTAPPAGPRPPLGVASCLFDAAGVQTLPTLAGGVNGMARLTIEQLSDGPFCGDGSMRYDADLLRVRRVVVRVRLAVPRAVAGGPISPLTAASTEREVVIDVAPRSLEAVR